MEAVPIINDPTFASAASLIVIDGNPRSTVPPLRFICPLQSERRHSTIPAPVLAK